ncbi:hypothetical protein BDQ17DRAFT_1331822 [Cyathus striatus]|nr:hypothetical protein BDQ17DRAFT_1331822 [Cyathus striatus]
MQWPMRFLVLSLLVTLAACQFMSQLPLIVKSPYLHSWVSANTVSTSGGWPLSWNGHILGWSSWIRVDGISYQWTGQTLSSRPNMTANEVTPTRTIFSFAVAGFVGFNVTYLSPIDPSDLVQQSLPFGYFYVDVWSLDGNSHSVQFYTDITGEMLSSDLTDVVQWNTTQSGNVVYHRMRLTSMQSMVEEGDIAKDSTLFLAIDNRPDMTWQTGAADALPDGLRARFNSGEPLTNTADTESRAINDTWPVLAFRVDLGTITQTSDPVVWSLGLVREPVIQYTTPVNVQLRSSYYWSAYNAVDDIVQDVIGKFNDIRSKAVNLDNKILADGGAISSNYSDLISFALRLVFGAMDITIPRASSGALNTSDVKIFMKDIGASRYVFTPSRLSVADSPQSSLPAILYLNASLAGLLLEPLLEYQNSSDYKNVYATPDLGITYPKVQGNTTDTTELALENCGNMLIMVLAHAMKSGDGSLLSRYYDLLKQWANYLEQNTLHPAGYINADGESNPNLSNLALKGIVGMYAMGKISEAAGMSSDASHYQSQAQNYTSQWESLAITSDHISTVYGDSSSSGLIYNLYAAKLLGQDSISSQIYDQQSQFYSSQIGTAPKFGFPYDTNDVGKAKSHWAMFTAATVSDSTVRDFITGSVWNRAALNDSNPFPTTYNPNTGSLISGTASSAQGAMFAQLALNVANQAFSVVSSPSAEKSKTNAGAIAGGVVGGVGGFLVFVGLGVFFWRRRQWRKSPSLEMQEAAVHEPFSSHPVGNDVNSIAISSAAEPIVGASKSDRTHHYYPSLGNSSSGAGMSVSPPSTTFGAASSSSGGPSQELRTEMEQLRREMEVLRSERLQDSEPPPLYDFGVTHVEDNAGAGRDAANSAGPLTPSRRKGAL